MEPKRDRQHAIKTVRVWQHVATVKGKSRKWVWRRGENLITNHPGTVGEKEILKRKTPGGSEKKFLFDEAGHDESRDRERLPFSEEGV